MIYNTFLELHVTVSDTASISMKCLSDKNSKFLYNFHNFLWYNTAKFKFQELNECLKWNVSNFIYIICERRSLLLYWAINLVIQIKIGWTLVVNIFQSKDFFAEYRFKSTSSVRSKHVYNAFWRKSFSKGKFVRLSKRSGWLNAISKG